MSDMEAVEKTNYPRPAEQAIPEQISVKNSFAFFSELVTILQIVACSLEIIPSPMPICYRNYLPEPGNGGIRLLSPRSWKFRSPLPHLPRVFPANVLTLFVPTGFRLVLKKSKKICFLLQDVFELLFEDVKPLPDVFEVPATRENDLS